MAKENKDFQLFQDEFKRWQKLLGLMNYYVCFRHEPIDSSVAQIRIDQEEMVAVVRLNTKLKKEDNPYDDIRKVAKHEALHLLIGKLERYGQSRYITEADMCEATEELVIRLLDLLPDLPEMKEVV